jgi:hypothetical protein
MSHSCAVPGGSNGGFANIAESQLTTCCRSRSAAGVHMQGSISMAAASLDDAKALQNMLTAIPNSQPLAEALKPGFAGSADIYHAATRTARYLRADGKFVVCFVLSDVTEQEAMAVREALAAVKIADLNLNAFKKAVKSTLQVEISRLN